MHVTYCPECKVQYRIPETHVKIVSGQTASCKKCRARFTVAVSEIPDPVPTQAQETETEVEEQTQEASSNGDKTTDASAPTTKKATRKTRAEIRHEQTQLIRSTFKSLHTRLSEINSMPASSEEDVRRWIVDALRHGLGYEDRDIRTEEKANDRRVDITVRVADEVSPTIVFEVKAIRKPLNQRVIEQVSSYAATLNAPYAVISNGDAWMFFKSTVRADGRRKLVEVFNIALLDEDGVSEADAQHLYLLTKKAILSGFTEKQCHQTAAIQPTRIWRALQEDSTLAKLRKTIINQYEEEAGVKVDLDVGVLQAHLESLMVPDEL